MDNQLLLGVILIVVGIALALLAYAFILNRREQDQGAEAGPPAEAEAPRPAAAAAAPPMQEAPPARPPVLPPVTPPAAPPVHSTATPVVPPPTPLATPASPTPTQAPPPPAPLPSRRTLAVATLLRDEVTGKISVLVGNREYSSVDELRASRDYSRVEYAAADLVEWLGAAAVRERTTERAREAVKKPLSMVEQIDAILQRMMSESAGGPRGVRLMEGADGSLRVYLGVQSYAFEDVPDVEVKRMIREAVAEWEAKK